MRKVLAIDMGATSIRGILGYIVDGKLVTNEIMRFSHDIVLSEGRSRWQWSDLINIIKKTIESCSEDVVSVGVDTWGVDIGFLDANGKLIETPIAYRDDEFQKGYELAVGVISPKDLFLMTGTQLMSINTLFQLVTAKNLHKSSWDKIEKVILMPDLVNYMLSGEKFAEETILSTAQVLDLSKRELNVELLEKLEIKKEIFPRIIMAGDKVGNTKNSLLPSLRNRNIDVISVCGHDTASAVLVTEAFKDKDTMFLSCGTWSLFGVTTEKSILTEEAYNNNLTNELGYGSQNMFFKNITGLYIFEKYKKELEEAYGRKIEFDEIASYVLNSKEELKLIDIEDERFAASDIGAKHAIDSYLKNKDIELPEDDFEYFRIIYGSLAEKYFEVKQAIEKITCRKYKKIHMIGGGAKSKVLCQLISNRLQIPIQAGPFEATALGNIIVQLNSIGEIDNIEAGRELIKNSEEVHYYEPMTSNM